MVIQGYIRGSWGGEGGGGGYTGIFKAAGEVKVGAAFILVYSGRLESKVGPVITQGYSGQLGR